MTAATRVLTFGGNAVSIACADAESAAIVAELYDGMPAGGVLAPRMAFTLARDLAGGFVLTRDGTVVCRDACRGTAAGMVLEESAYHLADGSRGGMLLHAASVAHGDRAVLLPAPTGAGKTTLAAWLVHRGFRYLTDEMVFVPCGSTRVEALARPLVVKPAGRAPLATLLDFDACLAATRCPDGFLVRPALLRHSAHGGALPGPAEGRLLVFPTYCAGAAGDLRPISAARAAMLLIAALVNARSLPGHGFAEVARLARALPAYALTYGAIDGIDERLAALLEGTS